MNGFTAQAGSSPLGASYAESRGRFRKRRRVIATAVCFGSPESSIVLLNAETVLGEVMSDAGAGQNPVEQPAEGRNSRNGACQYAQPEHEGVLPLQHRSSQIRGQAYSTESPAARLKVSVSHRVVIT